MPSLRRLVRQRVDGPLLRELGQVSNENDDAREPETVRRPFLLSIKWRRFNRADKQTATEIADVVAAAAASDDDYDYADQIER